MHFFRANTESDGGVAVVEYALIVGVIALLSVSAVTLVGERTEATFTDVAEAVDTSSSSDGGGSVEAPSDSPGGESDDQGSGDENPDDQGSDDQNQDDQDAESEDDQDDQDAESEDDPDDSDDNDSDEEDSEDDQSDGSDDEGSDDSGDQGSDQDEGSEDEDDENRPDPVVTRTDADFTWWNNTKHGGNGEWRASTEFRNDTDRHQYLRLEVTKVDEKGRKTTSIVDGFYVPANGSSSFSQWSNGLREHKGKITGVTEVQVDVISMTTSDQGWQPYTYEVDTAPISVDPPSIP